MNCMEEDILYNIIYQHYNSYRNFVFLAISYLFHSFITCISTLSLCLTRVFESIERVRGKERERVCFLLKSVGRPMTKPSIPIKFSVY